MVRETPIRNTYVHALANLEQVLACTLPPVRLLVVRCACDKHQAAPYRGWHVVLLYIPDDVRWLHCVIVSGTTGLVLVTFGARCSSRLPHRNVGDRVARAEHLLSSCSLVLE